MTRSKNTGNWVNIFSHHGLGLLQNVPKHTPISSVTLKRTVVVLSSNEMTDLNRATDLDLFHSDIAAVILDRVFDRRCLHVGQFMIYRV